MIEPKQVTHIGGIPGETAEAKIVKPSPAQKLWKYRWVILALGLHAAIFLWAFQMEIPHDEWEQIKAKAPQQTTLSYAKTFLKEKGPVGIIAALYNGNSTMPLYYHITSWLYKGNCPVPGLKPEKAGQIISLTGESYKVKRGTAQSVPYP